MSILREVTLEKHLAVESLPLIQHLVQGRATAQQYVVYLAEMLQIYQHLESLAAAAGLFENLPELPRAERIAQDLQELDANYQHEVTDSTARYLDYLTGLNKTQPSQLFAHVYVRHLGDLYGGKAIARCVPGSGQWYQFDNRAGLVKRFNSQLSMELADEALVAFDHYANIFSDLWKRINQ